MLFRGVGIAIFLTLIFSLGHAHTISIISHNTTVFGVCPVATLPYCYSGKHSSFNQVNTSGKINFPVIPFSKVNLTKLDLSTDAQFTGTRRFNVSEVNVYPANLSFIGTYTEWSPTISNFKLSGKNITLLIYPEVLNSLNILSWRNNITLHITYYLINISAPILSKDGNFLTCSSNLTTDFSGADLSTNFTFSRNGELMQNFTGSKNCLNSTECQYSVEIQNTSGNWTCEVFSGDWSVNSTVQAFNAPTEISAGPFQTDNSSSEHSFIARARAKDADGTSDISSCFVSSTLCGPTYLEATGNENEMECRATCQSASSQVSLNFTFSDQSGQNFSTGTENFATPNTEPEITGANITLTSQNLTRKYAEFSCSGDVQDPDSDEFSTEYLFYSTGFGTLRPHSPNSTFHCRESELCLKGEEIKCEIMATDSFSASSRDFSQGTLTIANSPPGQIQFSTPNNTVFNSTAVRFSFASGGDEDGDQSIHYFLIDGAGNYSADSSPIEFQNISAGNHTISGKSSDGSSESQETVLSFSVELPAPLSTSTTTTISKTTTAPPQSGGGGGGFPPISNASTTTTTIKPPTTQGPTIQEPVPGEDNSAFLIAIGNPTNASIVLKYDKAVLSCSPEEILPGKNSTVNCRFREETALFDSRVSIVSENRTVKDIVLVRSRNSTLVEKAKERIDSLFAVWQTCQDRKAKELMDSLQEEIDLEKIVGGRTAQLSALDSSAKEHLAKSGCDVSSKGGSAKSAESGESPNPTGNMPTPLFVAEPKTLPENENFFTKLLNAIISFFSKIFLKIKNLFGFP